MKLDYEWTVVDEMAYQRDELQKKRMIETICVDKGIDRRDYGLLPVLARQYLVNEVRTRTLH